MSLFFLLSEAFFLPSSARLQNSQATRGTHFRRVGGGTVGVEFTDISIKHQWQPRIQRFEFVGMGKGVWLEGVSITSEG